MKTIEYNHVNEHYITDIGTFKVTSNQGYNRFSYNVTKISGSWPTDKHELGSWLNEYYDIFGGSVQIGEDTAWATISGAD
jgi:hypothetical protein